MFKYYVLNYDFNKKKVVNFNIFDNSWVEKRTEQIVKKYIRAPSKYKYQGFDMDKPLYGFEAFCEELRSVIAGEEWGRFEYEIFVGGHGSKKIEDFERCDCYEQCSPNIEVIAREVIFQYKNKLKNQ